MSGKSIMDGLAYSKSEFHVVPSKPWPRPEGKIMSTKNRWDAIIERLHTDRPIIGAELGVWRGGLSEKLLRALPNLTLFGIDRWSAPKPNSSYAGSGAQIARMPQRDHDAAYDQAHDRIAFAGERVTLIKGETAESAKIFADGYFDFVFIDADHSYAGVTADLMAWYPKVKAGGWLCGHDWDHPDQGEVKEAVTDFLVKGKGYSESDIQLSHGRTWFLEIPIHDSWTMDE